MSLGDADADAGGRLAGGFVLGMLAGTPVAVALQRRTVPSHLLLVQLGVAALCWSALAVVVAMGTSPLGAWGLGLVALAGFAMAGSAGLVRSTLGGSVPQGRPARVSTLDALAQDVVLFLAPVAVVVGAMAGAPGAPAEQG